LEEFAPDTLHLYPGRAISEYLDPGLWEACHDPAPVSLPAPFLDTAPKTMVIQTLGTAEHQGQWVFWAILAGIAILTAARYYYLKRLKLLGQSVFKRSAALQLLRESPVHAHQSFIPFFSIYLIAVIVLIHQVMEVFSPGSAGGWLSLLLYAEFLGIYLAAFLLKILVIWLISVLFKNEETGMEYIQTIIIFNLALGIILLPMLLLIVYTWPQPMIFAAAGIALLIMVMRFVRGIAIGLSDTKFSLFHLFLYLCTLEILPLVIAAKFLSKYFFT
jgi:hypothetical protein